MPASDIRLRRLGHSDWEAAHAIIAELRPHLDPAELIRRLEIQARDGYELWGAFDGDALVGVMGLRPVHTLARGLYVHIDDLVVTPRAQRTGVGKALVALAEKSARERGAASIFLDARADAVGFYESLGYARHSAPSMKKAL